MDQYRNDHLYVLKEKKYINIYIKIYVLGIFKVLCCTVKNVWISNQADFQSH